MKTELRGGVGSQLKTLMLPRYINNPDTDYIYMFY